MRSAAYALPVPPPILYARSGETSVAYQVVGDGPAEMLMIPGWFSHLALDWEEPTWVRWCERLAAFARLVRFDKRGTGMSDRPEGIPTPDERMEDARGRARGRLARAVGPDRDFRPRARSRRRGRGHLQEDS